MTTRTAETFPLVYARVAELRALQVIKKNKLQINNTVQFHSYGGD
jgi:hypothetical protein